MDEQQVNDGRRRFRIVKGQPIPVGPNEPVPGDVDVFGIVDTLKRIKGHDQQSLEAIFDAFHPPAGGPAVLEDDAQPVDPPSHPSVNEAVERAITQWQSDPGKVLIRAADFGRIGDADLALFLAQCARKGLDPWKKEVYPRFSYNSGRDRMQLSLIVSFEKKVAIASATGLFSGLDKTEYEHDANGKLIAAHATIYKTVNGQRVPFVGDATMEEYYPGEGVDDLWDKMPKMNLKRCARSDALNMAFPQLQGLYTTEEFARAKGSADPSMVAPKQKPTEDQPAPSDDYGQASDDDDAPATPRAFDIELIGLGYKTPEQRWKVQQEYRAKFKGLAGSNPREYYRRVLAALRKMPPPV